MSHPSSKLLYYSEVHGCGATIKLDSQETCLVSISQSGVLVKSCRGKWGQFWISFFGSILYNEKNIYEASKASLALNFLYPEKCIPIQFTNLILGSFANAIWQCNSAAEVCIVLNEAIENAKKQTSASNYIIKNKDSILKTDNEVVGSKEVAQSDASSVSRTILEQKSKGSIDLINRTIKLFDGRADISTLVHEEMHGWLEIRFKYMDDPNVSQAFKDDTNYLRKWAGFKENTKAYSKEWVAAHEKVARAWERYLSEGVAPSASLAPVFYQFRQGMLGLYNAAERANYDINPEVRNIFDRMLAEKPERTVITSEADNKHKSSPVVTMEPLWRLGELMDSYAGLIESYAGAILDTAMLPLTKSEMKQAIKFGWIKADNAKLRDCLEVFYILLSHFQDGVGVNPIYGPKRPDDIEKAFAPHKKAFDSWMVWQEKRHKEFEALSEEFNEWKYSISGHSKL